MKQEIAQAGDVGRAHQTVVVDVGRVAAGKVRHIPEDVDKASRIGQIDATVRV